MGIMVYSLLWVMQEFYHQPHDLELRSYSDPVPKFSARARALTRG